MSEINQHISTSFMVSGEAWNSFNIHFTFLIQIIKVYNNQQLIFIRTIFYILSFLKTTCNFSPTRDGNE